MHLELFDLEADATQIWWFGMKCQAEKQANIQTNNKNSSKKENYKLKYFTLSIVLMYSFNCCKSNLLALDHSDIK